MKQILQVPWLMPLCGWPLKEALSVLSITAHQYGPTVCPALGTPTSNRTIPSPERAPRGQKANSRTSAITPGSTGHGGSPSKLWDILCSREALVTLTPLP